MSLLIDISDLEPGVGQSLDFRLRACLADVEFPGDVSVGETTVVGRATWTGRTLLVEGTVRAEAEFTCGRCLARFTRELETRLSREFRPVGPKVTPDTGDAAEQGPPRGRTGGRRDAGEEEVDLDDAPEEPLPCTEDTVDLAFPVWEALVLEFPMKPVCREDCRGLCPVCGANLNLRTCGCEAEKADPRLLSLKKLLDANGRGE